LIAGGWLVLATLGTWWVVPALLLQGLFVNALFGAMHESVHYGSFKTRWAADLLAFFSGAAILNNAGFYRHYHLAHHRYTQDPARDPELVTSGTPKTWGPYLFRVSSIPFLMLRMRDIFLFPFGYRGNVDYIHPSAWPEAERWGRWLLAFYVALIAGSIALHTDVVLWVWFIPLLVGLPFLRLYLMCEHTLCPNSDDGFANTRTTLSNPVVRFLMWNLPYHAEHHLFPNIAFHNLPEAHRHLRPHLKYVAKGYVGVQREIVQSLA
jgi:fatty acid desaturase